MPSLPPLQFRSLTGPEVAADHALFEAVLALDRANMEEIMRASNFQNFPWDLRIKGLTGAETRFFAAFDRATLAGYLEVRPHHREPDAIYISSIRIAPAYRNSRAFITLLRMAHTWLLEQPLPRLLTEVQSANTRMTRMLRKLGFEFHEGKHAHTRFAAISRTALASQRLFHHTRSGWSPDAYTNHLKETE